MLFPWDKYEEIKTRRCNTLQVFITRRCNLRCVGCFAKNMMKSDDDEISVAEYREVIENLVKKGGEKVNLLGGEPALHTFLEDLIQINRDNGLRTTVYTNGHHIQHWDKDFYHKSFKDTTVRVSVNSRLPIYSDGKLGQSKCVKGLRGLGVSGVPVEICFMVSSRTTEEELLCAAAEIENHFNCKVFFISSLRELDNPRKEFFDDTILSMPVIRYKELVHNFLIDYDGDMEIHISKRGVFESTTTLAENKCRFANYIPGGKIIQCPYDLVNLKYQDDYEFGVRHCQHNNTCLMSKIVVKRRV